MRKFVISLFLVIGLLVCAFSDMRKITVEQYMRYTDGNYAQLLMPQISKSKAMKTGKGKVFLRYDFSVLKTSGKYDIKAVISFLRDLPIIPTGIDGAFPAAKYDVSFGTDRGFIARENSIANIYETNI